MPDEAKGETKGRGGARKPRKRSAPMHAFQVKRETWKRNGKKGPEPERPTQDEIDAASS